MDIETRERFEDLGFQLDQVRDAIEELNRQLQQHIENVVSEICYLREDVDALDRP